MKIYVYCWICDVFYLYMYFRVINLPLLFMFVIFTTMIMYLCYTKWVIGLKEVDNSRRADIVQG